MSISDHWSGLMLLFSNLLANSRRMSSKSHFSGTSGRMLSGPDVFPSRRLYLATFNSSSCCLPSRLD